MTFVWPQLVTLAARRAGDASPSCQAQVQQQQPPPTPPQTGAPPAGGQGRRGGGGGGRGGAPIPFDNFTGFDKIFDGATLTNWDGDPTFWRVEGGAIVGETTAEKPVTENTFLIYRGSEPDNFELKLEFRMNSTNSGVQYRSRQLTGAVGKWVLCGYQADIDFANSYTGMLYEERGRPGFLAPRGTVQYAGPNDVQQGQCSSGQPVAPRGQGAGRAGSDAAGGRAIPQRAGSRAPPRRTSAGRRCAVRSGRSKTAKRCAPSSRSMTGISCTSSRAAPR